MSSLRPASRPRSLAALAAGLLAVLLAVPPSLAAQTTVVRADRMLNVASGEMVSPATVVVREGRIAAVNPNRPPEDAETVDLGDVTLLPGLMDTHVHLTYHLDEGFFTRQVTSTAADRAIRGVVNAEKVLMAGFTTVRNVGARHFADVALAEASAENRIPAPRIVPAAHALSITGGHCDVTGFAPGIRELGPEQGIADGVDEVLEADLVAVERNPLDDFHAMEEIRFVMKDGRVYRRPRSGFEAAFARPPSPSERPRAPGRVHEPTAARPCIQPPSVEALERKRKRVSARECSFPELRLLTATGPHMHEETSRQEISSHLSGREPKIVEKPWGREVWYAHNDRYAGKILEVDAGHQLSLQKHRVKHETLFLHSGRVRFELDDEEFEWEAGQRVEIPPETVHRMEAVEDSVILEVSTPELDDVVRLQDRYGRS